jgi:hypothetical protein
MQLFHIKEPRLEFAQGIHVCPRAGIANYEVYDTILEGRRDTILVGAIGTNEGIAKLNNWLDICSKNIPGKKDAKQPNLFPAFCGFNKDYGFKTVMSLIDRNVRILNHSEVQAIQKMEDWNNRIASAVNLYLREVAFLAQHRSVDVIICILPDDLYDLISKEERKPLEETLDDEDEPAEYLELNFRRALKAWTMYLGKPIQLMREQSLELNVATQQDDATKAWNFCTAIYYKASNQTVPWKLESNPNKPSVCFIGIGFYKSRDRKVLHTSLAQIFDELGNGVILRGMPVQLDKTDRQPHLSAEQARQLLEQALNEYSVALNNFPARLVVHKSSNYSQSELEGFRAAAHQYHIRTVDFVTILDSDVKLFRSGIYPPYRGTRLELDKTHHLLYTRGSVEYYHTYPGSYIPQPLEVRIVEADESPEIICSEILGLTKMNWNNTQFDGKYPITLSCARRVGAIMKYLAPDIKAQIRYSFYM